MALGIFDGSLCPCGCGQPAIESQNPANEFAYEPDGPYRCHARTALARAQESHGDAEQDRALLWAVRLKT